MALKDDKTQTFSFETVAVLVATLISKGGTLGMEDYKFMSSLDGTRGASSFDHQFRKVKARAQELKAKMDGGEVGTPVKKAKGISKKATPGDGEKKKRGS